MLFTSNLPHAQHGSFPYPPSLLVSPTASPVLPVSNETWDLQHPEQGLVSQNPSADLEAMRKAHNSAINSNEKIFPIFAKKLASKDTKEFVSTARKLALWLGSEKAYYLAARPKIIELLEIALSAFSETFIHHPTMSELAEHLQRLVQAVMPFKHLFLENELRSRLHRVILDVNLFLSRITTTAHTISQAEESITANMPSPTPASPVHPQPTIPPVPVVHTPTWRIQAALPTPSAANEGLDGTIQTDSPQARDPSQLVSSNQIGEILSPASPVAHTLQNPDGKAVPSKPQPKRVRRAELSEELIARDLDWYKSTHSSAIANEDPTASPFKAGESSPALAADAPRIPRQSPSPRKKTARMVPSRRLPRRIHLDATEGTESGVSTSTLLPPAEPSGGSHENTPDVSILMDVDEENPSLERTGSVARAPEVPGARDVYDIPRPEELPSPESRLVVVASNEPSSEPQIPRTDYQSPSVEHPLTSGETPIPTRPSVLLPEAMSDRMESMDISNADSGSERPPSEHPIKPESTPPGSPRMLQLRSPVLPPLVNALEPPLNLNFKIPQTSSGQLRQSEKDANERRFDDEMTVIYSTQGKPFTHTHAFDVSLSESIFSKISKWANRKSRPSDASQGVCISLACYRFPELFDTIEPENDKHGIEALMSRSLCSWPSSNRSSLHVHDGETRTTVTLSPPLFLTPDQYVDISSLMKPGDNTLEIKQKDDLSEYLFVLHAHPPTRAQLAELDVIKAADERWKRFLDVISARVVRGNMLGDVYAGGVEVMA